MRRQNVYELDIDKEIRKYDELDAVLYSDSRYYRKNKPKFSLNERKIYASDSDKNANL